MCVYKLVLIQFNVVYSLSIHQEMLELQKYFLFNVCFWLCRFIGGFTDDINQYYMKGPFIIVLEQ